MSSLYSYRYVHAEQKKVAHGYLYKYFNSKAEKGIRILVSACISHFTQKVIIQSALYQSTWNTSSMSAHHSPSLRVSSGFWHGIHTSHQRWVSGSAAILAMSAS